jgi:hypothetical protein
MSHILVRSADGILMGKLESVISWSYARQANDLGWFSIQTSDIDRSLLAVDRILEFYRTPIGAGPILLGIGFLRAWEWTEDGEGRVYLQLDGPDQIDLLARRVVAYNTPESMWSKSGPADDSMKAVVRENMGTLVQNVWYPLRTRAYPAAQFSVAPDEGDARSVVRTFQYRNVLEVCKQLAEASMWPSSDNNWTSTPVWFDCEYVGPAQFQFKTWCPNRGVDRTLATNLAPLTFAKEAGNLQNPALKFDYSEEENIVYGLGPGDGTSRMVDPENDPARGYLSPFNVHEGIEPATEETTLLGVAWRAYYAMQERRPRVIFSGSLIDTPLTRFGVDWGFGDVVTVRYRGMEFDGRVDSFVVSGDQEGRETVEATVTITKALEGKPD